MLALEVRQSLPISWLCHLARVTVSEPLCCRAASLMLKPLVCSPLQGSTEIMYCVL